MSVKGFFTDEGVENSGRSLLLQNLGQGNHHEVAFVHVGMRYVQLRQVDGDIVVQQDVDVNDAVVVLAVDGFFGAPHPFFYLLCGVQQVGGGEGGVEKDAGVDEPVGGVETPRFCLVE